MSADNYLWVRKWQGRYYVSQEFASDEVNASAPPNPRAVAFNTPTEACSYAHQQELEDYFEYGVFLTPEVSDELAQLATIKP